MATAVSASRSNGSNTGGGVSRLNARNDPQLNAELEDLQRKYRGLEKYRRDVGEENPNTIRMQKTQMEKLQKDHSRIKEELYLETQQANRHNSMQITKRIANIQDQTEIYQSKIEMEKKLIKKYTNSIEKMQEKILKQCKENGGINANRDLQQSIHKQIRTLENRLDKSLIKFNEALAHNKNLRETIDNLRRDRVVFDGIYRKLERELLEKKNKMSEIMEIHASVYEARDIAQLEMNALKSSADGQQKTFEREWGSLGDLIEKDRQMKATIITKEKLRALMLGNEDTANIDPHKEEVLHLKKKINKNEWQIAKEKANISYHMEKVYQYEESFAKISDSTKMMDVDQLISKFVSAEDENFTLFNQVNSFNSSIEKVEEEIEEIKLQLKMNALANGIVDTSSPSETSQTELVAPDALFSSASSSQQRQILLAELKQQQLLTVERTKESKRITDMALSQLKSIKETVQSLFLELGCDKHRIEEKVGKGGINESNLMDYLAEIELKVNSLQEKPVNASGFAGLRQTIKNGMKYVAYSDLYSNPSRNAKNSQEKEEKVNESYSTNSMSSTRPFQIQEEKSECEDESTDDAASEDQPVAQTSEIVDGLDATIKYDASSQETDGDNPSESTTEAAEATEAEADAESEAEANDSVTQQEEEDQQDEENDSVTKEEEEDEEDQPVEESEPEPVVDTNNDDDEIL